MTISATAGDDEVIVRVLDDGPGFPEPRRRTACSSCSTVRRARPATASGAGIGLFVCARLIRAMGGRIWASPRPEGGAEFGFALRELDE